MTIGAGQHLLHYRLIEKILLHTSDESGRDEVYATSFLVPGRRWKISSDGDSWPSRTGSRSSRVAGSTRIQHV